MIYFDNAATTYPKPECVYEELDRANRYGAFNAGRGEYLQAKQAFSAINTAREKLASIVEADAKKVVFTSSATEALNMIIGGLDCKTGDAVYVSPFEHNAIVRPLKALEKKGVLLRIIPFNSKTWEPDLAKLNDEFVLFPPKAVFISHVSNVTGYIVPFEGIFELSKQFSAVNILDCSQSFGIVPCKTQCIDYAVFAGHKSLYASFGVGGFILLSNHVLLPTKFGGTGSDSLNPSMPAGMPFSYEAGSPNVVAISAINCSVNWLRSMNILDHEKALTIYAIQKIRENPKIKLFLPPDIGKIIGIISFVVNGYSPEDVGSILSNEYNILLRTGYHCAPFVHDFIGSRECGGTVRASFGAFNSTKEIDVLVDALKTL